MNITKRKELKKKGIKRKSCNEEPEVSLVLLLEIEMYCSSFFFNPHIKT